MPAKQSPKKDIHRDHKVLNYNICSLDMDRTRAGDTPQNQDKKRLQQDVNHWQTVFEAIDDSVCILDPNGKIVWCNDRLGRLLKKPLDEIIGRYCWQLMHGTTEPIEGCPVARMKKSLKKEMMVLPVGNQWFDVLAYPILDQGGNLNGVVHIFSDVTVYKQSEISMREQRDRAQQYLDIAGVMFIAIDADEKVSLVNKKGCEVLGLREDEIVGQNWFDHFIPASNREQIRDIFRKLINEEISSLEYYENSVVAGSGQEKIVAWHNTLLRDNSGKIIGSLSSGEDVTEKRRLEVELRHAQKMEAIGTLAGGIAHDFNNLLGVIVGNTELALLDIPEWNQARGNLDEILKASLRARDVVKQILSFSRQAEVDKRPMSIGDLVKEASRFLKAFIPNTIELRHNINTKLDRVIADPTQIYQVLLNLCANASYAMRETGGVLEINVDDLLVGPGQAMQHADLKPGLKPGSYVCVTVKDTGCGIASEIMARIFDPYFTTKSVGEGSGMGLAVALGIVRNHCGTIRAESQPGKGTIFSIFLPHAMPESGC